MAHLQTHDNDIDPQVKPTPTATDLIILDVEPIPPCSDIPLAPTAVHLTPSIDHSTIMDAPPI